MPEELRIVLLPDSSEPGQAKMVCKKIAKKEWGLTLHQSLCSHVHTFLVLSLCSIMEKKFGPALSLYEGAQMPTNVSDALSDISVAILCH